VRVVQKTRVAARHSVLEQQMDWVQWELSVLHVLRRATLLRERVALGCWVASSSSMLPSASWHGPAIVKRCVVMLFFSLGWVPVPVTLRSRDD